MKKIFLALLITLVVSTLSMLFVVPAAADVQPPGANSNILELVISRAPLVYHDGDTIEYNVTVAVPAWTDGLRYAKVTDIITTFTTPHGTVVSLPIVPTLNPGDSVTFTSADNAALAYVIAHGDEILVGGHTVVTASAEADGTSHVSPNNDPAFASREITTEVFHPSITVTKTADPTSKVGDAVTYTLTVANTGDGDLTRVSVNDSLLGDVSSSFPATLAAGTSSGPITLARTVQAGDPDPLLNTVTATYQDADGATASGSASATTDLVHPAIHIAKSVNPTSGNVGDTVTYTITLTNTGDIGLINITVNDTLLGDLSGSFADTLAPTASETHTFTYTLQSTDPNPLPNTATVHANPEGLPNDITDSDNASVTIGGNNVGGIAEMFDPGNGGFGLSATLFAAIAGGALVLLVGGYAITRRVRS